MSDKPNTSAEADAKIGDKGTSSQTTKKTSTANTKPRKEKSGAEAEEKSNSNKDTKSDAAKKKATAAVASVSPTYLWSALSGLLLLILIVLGIALGTGWLFIKQRIGAGESAEKTQLAVQLDALKTATQSDVAQFTAQLAQQTQRLAAQQQQLENLAALQNSAPEQDTARLLHIDLQVRLAALGLLARSENDLVVAHLKAALAQAKLLPEAKQQAMAQALAADIQTVDALPQPDLNVLLGKCFQLAKQLAGIELTDTRPAIAAVAAKPAVTPAPTTATHAGWLAHLHAALAQIGQVIVIRHHVNDPNKVLPIEQHMMVRHQLLLLVEQIQWAIVSRNDDLLQSRLADLRHLLLPHIDQKTPAASQIKALLDELAASQLAPAQAVHLKAPQLIKQYLTQAIPVTIWYPPMRHDTALLPPLLPLGAKL